jgi:hypothetical protein
MDIEEVNKITFVLIADDSSLRIIKFIWAIPMSSGRNASKCMSMAWAFGAFERVKGVHHTTVISWVKTVGENLPDAYDPDQIPQVGELDELETFVGSKKIKSGCGQQ